MPRWISGYTTRSEYGRRNWYKFERISQKLHVGINLLRIEIDIYHFHYLEKPNTANKFVVFFTFQAIFCFIKNYRNRKEL